LTCYVLQHILFVVSRIAGYPLQGSGSTEIAASIETGIVSGALPAGARLPTVRELAADLGVSTATVATAFRLLRERGLVSANGRAGTRVSARRPRSARRVAPPIPSGVMDLARGNPDPQLLPDLRPALAEVVDRLASDGGRSRKYGEGGNLPALLAALEPRLAADGLPVGPITVANGALDGIERALRTVVRSGDGVVVEDPAYCGLLDLLDNLGLRAIPVATDDSGPLPEELTAALARRPVAAVLTPRAQNPTGSAWSASRAAELKAVLAAQPQLLVVEDDPLAEVADTPLHDITVAAGRDRWVYVRTLSKSLGPDLRLAAVLADPTTSARVAALQQATTGWVSWLVQHLAAILLDGPGAERSRAEAGRCYEERRTTFKDALNHHGIGVRGVSGYNVWVPVSHEASTVQALLAVGWAVRAGEVFRVESPPGLRVTVAELSPERAPQLAADLAGALAAPRRNISA
jgi:DNA-binding transcriptional MocR family regulator